MCLRSHVLNLAFQDIGGTVISLNQKDARKKKILIRNDEKAGMWAVQYRKTVRAFGHCQRETLPVGTRKKLRG